MRRDLLETLRFIGYILFMPMFILSGLIYKPLKWITHKCAPSVK